MIVLDVDQVIASLYEGKGSALRERTLRALDHVDPHTFAVGLAARFGSDVAAIPAVAAIVDDWVETNAGSTKAAQRRRLHTHVTPLVLALRDVVGPVLLPLGRGSFNDVGLFLAVCLLFTARVDDAFDEAGAVLDEIAARERYDRGDRAHALRRIYFTRDAAFD